MGMIIEGGIAVEGGISIVVDTGVPLNSIAPVISVSSPNVRVGKTLNSTTGNWISSYPILGYNYQWYADNIIIVGAVSNSYIIQIGDLGKYITCKVIAYTTYGNSAPSESNSLGPVLPAVVAPSIGDYVYGGYYAGISGTNYIIVSDNAVGQGITSFNNAYSTCQALIIGLYNDWRLPLYSSLLTMDNASTDPGWPINQGYNSAPTVSYSNYWPTGSYPKSNSTLVTCWNFYYNTSELIYANNAGISFRAVRYETIPT